MTAVVESLARGARGLRWYLRQVTGESKWDDYLERCRREGVEPMSRRDFERQRQDHQESCTQSRCC